MVTKTNLATGHPLRRLDCIVLLFLPTLMFSSHVWPFKSNRFKLPFRFLLWTHRVTSGGSVSPDVTWNPKALGGFTMCTACTVHNQGLWEWDWRQMRSGTPLPCGISLPLSLQSKAGTEVKRRKVIDPLTKLFCLERLYHIALVRFTVRAEQGSGLEGLAALGSKD